MRNFNWDALPRQSVLGKRTVWTSHGPVKDFQLDTRRMEEMFSRTDSQAPLAWAGVGRQRVTTLAIKAPPLVSILTPKKSMNLVILLKQYKRPFREMVEDIRQGNWLRFGAGKLRELCKLLPEKEEVKRLLEFKGDLSLLPEADQFMVQLVHVPGYEERLRTLMLREEFFPLMEEMKNSTMLMTKAANELLNSDDLHSIIRLVLKAGNYMNDGGYAGSAIGFRMASLLKLVDTKANKPGMNLMHYVAMQAQEIDVALLKFPNQLKHIGQAARVHAEEVVTEFQKEVRKVEDAKMAASRQPDLLRQMDAFLKRAEEKLSEVEACLTALQALSHTVGEYFCEDPAVFKLDECFAIFNSFCERFNRAVQENRERELAELRRKQREALQRAAKRRSIAACFLADALPGAASSPSTPEPPALENALHTLLSRRGAGEGSSLRGSTRRRPGRLSPVGGSPADPGCTLGTAGREMGAGRSHWRRSREGLEEEEVKEEGRRGDSLGKRCAEEEVSDTLIKPCTEEEKGNSLIKPFAEKEEGDSQIKPCTEEEEGENLIKPFAEKEKGDSLIKPCTDEVKGGSQMKPSTEEEEGDSLMKPRAGEEGNDSLIKPGAEEEEEKEGGDSLLKPCAEEEEVKKAQPDKATPRTVLEQSPVSGSQDTATLPLTRPGQDEKEDESEEEGEEAREEEEEEEARRLQRLSRYVLLYQSSRGSLYGEQEDPPDPPAPMSPPARPLGEVDMSLVTSRGTLGSPWTILSPRATSRDRRRPPQRSYSPSRLGESSPGERAWTLPFSPTRPSTPRRRPSTTCPSPLTLRGRSPGVTRARPSPQSPHALTVTPGRGPGAGASSLPDCPARRATSRGPAGRRPSLEEARGTPATSSSWLGDLFHRHQRSRSGSYSGSDSGPGSTSGSGSGTSWDRQDSSSGIVSFFRRLGDRSRRGSAELDSS